MSAECEAHGAEHFVGVGIFSAGTEARIHRCAEDGNGYAFIDGGVEGPASFAGVRDLAGELLELGIGEQGLRGEVEKPTGDDGSTTPYLRDIAERKIVLIQIGIAERGG